MDDDFTKMLEAAKKASVAQVLMKCGRLLNERGVHIAQARFGVPELRPSHMSVFPHVDFEGTRLTEIARRMGISKQAAGQLVSDLEDMGMLERTPDPEDGRAKLVRFGEAGQARLLEGLEVLKTVEDELTEALGKKKMRALHTLTVELLAVLESET